MILDSELSVRLLDLLHGCILFNTEKLVQLGVLDFFFGTSASHSSTEAGLLKFFKGESSATAEKHG